MDNFLVVIYIGIVLFALVSKSKNKAQKRAPKVVKKQAPPKMAPKARDDKNISQKYKDLTGKLEKELNEKIGRLQIEPANKNKQTKTAFQGQSMLRKPVFTEGDLGEEIQESAPKLEEIKDLTEPKKEGSKAVKDLLGDLKARDGANELRKAFIYSEIFKSPLE